MDERIRHLERAYEADPTPDNLKRLVKARIRSHQDAGVQYRIYFDRPGIRELFRDWNDTQIIKIDTDFWHYPFDGSSIIVWPGFPHQNNAFESLLDKYGVTWEYIEPKPYPEDVADGPNYLEPPASGISNLRDLRRNPKKRIRKMVRPKKQRSTGRVTKHFGDPQHKVEFTHQELVDLKNYWYYQKGQLLIYPEFKIGCRQCGEEAEHREWCATLFEDQDYRRNADESLRRLERDSWDDPQARIQYMLRLYRTGRIEEFLQRIDDKMQRDIAQLNAALAQANYFCQVPEIFNQNLVLSPEPPPPTRFLHQISGLPEDSEYFISEVGSHGTAYSELAMHCGLTGNDIEQYLLISQDPPNVTWALVQFFSPKENRSIITDGLPSEVLSQEIRRELGYQRPQLPSPSSNYYPMVPYEATIVGEGDRIYRAKLSLFYYPHQAYWRLAASGFDYHTLAPILNSALSLYKESYES